MIEVLINQQPISLPACVTLTQALAQSTMRPPFAVAINQQFVPRSHYEGRVLKNGDVIDVVAPITGG
ncbi:MAG: sulfur carrier protein ThiS [Ottowia sp.]|nr:sulfur carrier protein ThiS [Ottowia sp.]